MNNNEDSYCVIMAGGIGSRFWPYSRSKLPKQFLDFFGTGRSLLQMTVDRFKRLVPIENIIIVTNIAYRQTILEQIPDLDSSQILCEPARRNTAPCIAYAVAHIKGLVARKRGKLVFTNKEWHWNGTPDWENDNMNANIVIAPSDHIITQEDAFLNTIKTSFEFTQQSDSLLTLGIKPNRPETGYGYIQVQKDTTDIKEEFTNVVYKVKTFTEKPNSELAKVFLESGEFVWNSGIFIWNLRAICSAFKKYIPDLADTFISGEAYWGTSKEEEFIQRIFPSCPNISIDYGVMEKADNVYVIPSNFGWSDLGTWGSVYELSEKDNNANTTIHSEALYYNSTGNIVTLEKGKLAVIEGLHDMIIAESNGVLLICSKKNEQQIKTIMSDVTEHFGGKYT